MKKINYLMSMFAIVLALGVMSCDPNENSVTPDNPLEEYVGNYALTSSLNGTDETLPSNPDFRIGNDFGQTSKHFSFVLSADGTGTFIGNVASEPMTWKLNGTTLTIKYYGTNYNLNVTSHTSSEMIATLSGNVNTYIIN